MTTPDTIKHEPALPVFTYMIEEKPYFRIILGILLFFIPINIYIIGTGIGTGIQWALFRYQQTGYGNSLITLDMDLGYVIAGVITGRSAVSISAWLVGVLLLISALIILLLSALDEERIRPSKAGILILLAGLAWLASDMLQYGLIFSGPAGVAIPVGIPLVCVVGWWLLWKEENQKKEEASSAEPPLTDE